MTGIEGLPGDLPPQRARCTDHQHLHRDSAWRPEPKAEGFFAAPRLL
jgi:hypothetical protein